MPERGEGFNPIKSNERSDRRLRAFAWSSERVVAHKPHVDGWENYNELVSNPNNNFVIAATHRSDSEVQAVVDVFSPLRKLGLVTHSFNVMDSNGEWKLPAKVIGKDNFMVLGVNRDPEQTTEARARDRYHLDPEEILAIARRMRTEHITPVVAAHRPAYHSPLPKNPGVMDVLLAHAYASLHEPQTEEEKIILPVAVDWQGREPVGNSHEMGQVVKNLVTRNRPEIAIHIAPAVYLEGLPQLDPELAQLKSATDQRTLTSLDLAMMTLSSSSRALLTPEQREYGLTMLRQLEKQSGQVMDALANTLPEADRGIWGKKDSES